MRAQIIKGCESRGDADSPYLSRYPLVQLGGYRLCLHVFHRSDAIEQHDHPWFFVSLLLWRGYIEQTPAGKKRYWPGAVLWRSATHRHRIELVDERRAISLVLMGPHRREWGFFTPAGWQGWRAYFTQNGC